MGQVSFAKFTQKNPHWETDYGVYQRDSEKFKRINCRHEEWLGGSKVLAHEFHAVINTSNGDIYMDCRRRKILAKHPAILCEFLTP